MQLKILSWKRSISFARLPTKVHLVKAIVFPVVMYRELDQKEAWALKNWCFPTVVLEKTLESPFECKEIKPVNPKRNQPWTFTGRTVAEVEIPTLWPRDVKSQLTGKDSDAEKDWSQPGSSVQARFSRQENWSGLLFPSPSIHDYWKNHSFDYMDLCWQSGVSAF